MPKPNDKPRRASFFTIDNEKLIHYKITPDYNIENTSNEQIVKALSYLYKTPKERFGIKNMTYTKQRRCYFDILLVPGGAYFYISISKEYSSLLKNKLETIWPNAAITRIDPKKFRDFDFNRCEIGNLILRDYNFKSLNTSKNDLYPLTNMLGITRDLIAEHNEKVMISFAIEPIKRRNWIAIAKDEYKNFKKGELVDNSMSAKERAGIITWKILEFVVMMFIEFRMLLLESVLGIFVPSKEEEKERIEVKIDSLEAIKEDNKLKGLSPSTHYKMSSEAFDVDINIISQSDDRHRRNINLISVANSYKDLNEDNELILKKLKRKEQSKIFKEVITYSYSISKPSTFSDKEVAKFIQMPQKSLQQEYKLDNIDTREIEIPEELLKGEILLGVAEKQRNKIKTYFATDKNIAGLPITISGPQNAGKTTLIKRITKDSHNKAKYSNIYIDHIENCENSSEVAEVISKSERVIIRLGEKECVPPLAYTEVSKRITEDMDPWYRVKYANMLAEQVEYLINSVTDKSTGELTAPMLRYLHAACMVVFIKPYAKINDVFEVLRKWEVRNEYIRYAKYESGCFYKDDDIFYNLEELHDRNNEGKIVGTRENLIIGITNRITILKKNPYIKSMLRADIKDDFDFSEMIKEGKSIFIQIPRPNFPDPKMKDILATFYMSRIWLTVQLRENNKDARLCKVIHDELHHTPTCGKFIRKHITEFRRNRLGLIVTCHHFKQLERECDGLFTELKNAGTSFILLCGTGKENFETLKEEIQPFTIDDCLALKKWHSLNIINYGNRYTRFISNQPVNNNR